MKSTITTAIEILNKVNNWANSSYAHLCNREGYPRGYREGIAFSHETINKMLGNNIADVISALNDDAVELANLREENETLRNDNKNLDEMRDSVCRSANRANMEIVKLQKENHRLLVELAKFKIVHGRLDLTDDERAAGVPDLSIKKQ